MLEFIVGTLILFGYFIICASTALLLRRFFAMPKEVFRKILHVILLMSVFIVVYAYSTWWISALAALSFILLVFPILMIGEHYLNFSKLLIERQEGEIKRSLVVAFSMFIILISICWGWLGEKYLIIVSVLAWGVGDAAAALIGKRFGKHVIEGKLVEGSKTQEGTLAMFITSFFTVLIALLIHGKLASYLYLPTALVIAAVVALVELYTKNGMDTITCPLAAAAILIFVFKLWGV